MPSVIVSSRTMAAPPRVVHDLLTDVEAWALWSPHIASVDPPSGRTDSGWTGGVRAWFSPRPVDLPLAENTDRNVGLSFEGVATALDVLPASPRLGALTITEINPHHGEPDGATLRRFVERIVRALAAR